MFLHSSSSSSSEDEGSEPAAPYGVWWCCKIERKKCCCSKYTPIHSDHPSITTTTITIISISIIRPPHPIASTASRQASMATRVAPRTVAVTAFPSYAPAHVDLAVRLVTCVWCECGGWVNWYIDRGAHRSIQPVDASLRSVGP